MYGRLGLRPYDEPQSRLSTVRGAGQPGNFEQTLDGPCGLPPEFSCKEFKQERAQRAQSIAILCQLQRSSEAGRLDVRG
jgi:hypothetical protein